jgi:putative ATP-dependent endonuclease of OLD family
MRRVLSEEEWKKLSFEDVIKKAKRCGIFLNEYTFEIDLFREGAEQDFAQAMKELTDNQAMHKRFDELAEHPEKLAPKQFLQDINSVGKGRLAQRLASLLLANGSDVCPPYIAAALDYIKVKLA